MNFQMPVFIDNNPTDIASMKRRQIISQIRGHSPSDKEIAIAEARVPGPSRRR
jgi:hypothetical protein